MAAANQSHSIQQAETEIAVLKVQVDNIEEKVGEIKTDLRELQVNIKENAEITAKTLDEMKKASSDAHKTMNEKVASLEKWRWMLMGAGVALGALGHNMLGNLLK